MKSYINQCGTCENSESREETCINQYQKYYCEWYKCYYYPDDSCDRYKEYIEESNGCYITTIICNVLGFTDDCFVLTEMRDFRNNIMQKNPKYFNILLEYDIIGSVIAHHIQEEYEKTENKDMWIRFYQLYLSPIVNLISGGNSTSDKEYEMAVAKYQQMIGVLKAYFGIPEIDFTDYQQSYDMSNGGHGKRKLRTIITSA